MSDPNFSAEAWPSWNVKPTTPPVISIEGHNIQEVFSMVNIQLETLRKIVMQQGKALKEAAVREEALKDKHAIQLTKLNSRLDGLQNKISDGDVGKMESRLHQCENKIMELERQVLMEKDSALKSVVVSQKALTADNTSRLDELEQRISEVKNQAINSDRIIECESKIGGLLTARTDLHSRVVHLEDGQAWFSNEATVMAENYSDLLKNHDVSMNEIKDLQAEVYDSHTPDIKRLFLEKMDNSDEMKLILASLREHEDGNKSMLARLESLLGELDRRVMLLGSECRDDLGKMKHKTDKKIDFLHKWIVKYVGTALRDENVTNETDIGTIRCLVCSHPSKKLDTDTPFVNPDFRNTLGYFHDEQHDFADTKHGRDLPSSPLRDPKYRTDGSPPRLRGAQSLPQQGALHPEGATSSAAAAKSSSSKFAKLRSVPSSSADYVDQYAADDFAHHVDITEDRYSGPRTIGDPKTVAFYNDMTRC